MERRRKVAAISLALLIGVMTLPAFAGGSDVPGIPPGHHPKTQARSFEHTVGAFDLRTPMGRFLKLMGGIWGGGK